ncbi:MAG TPA: PLP-dependent aminotransferase family protein [Thermoanaerobaculia bacterium]|nr:PLP-dependent aminotransferase family protein [Thermoanaerobaculia bacterium]
MTIWSPRLPDSPGPIYARIAEALERDVRAGVLISGSQLPTHRDLARALGITPVTVTRAYAEAARRGLVESATGRGTFVRAPRPSPTLATRGAEIDLATNVVNIPLPLPSPSMLERAARTLAGATYAAGAGSERHRAAGAAWVAPLFPPALGRTIDPSRVVVTAGTQHGILLAFAASARAGETILAESVTYHGAKAAAAMLGIRLQPLPLDRFGILPDALARACRGRGPKVLYTIPSLHNPTGIVVPEKRRREIAAVAAKHGLTIIEDDVCGFLLERTPPPIAAFAPERTIFLTGLGKALAPALRVGYVVGPASLLPRLHSALAASVLFSSPLTAELAASWIEDGTAAKIVELKRAEVALRNRTARRILPAAAGDARSGHLWMALPKRWTPDAFAEEARRRRVRVASATSFAVGDDVPRAVRICIGGAASVAELETALHVLAGIGEERIEGPVV